MRHRLIVVGRDKNDALVQCSAEYRERLARSWPVEVVEIKEAGNASTPDLAMRREADGILKSLDGMRQVVALTPRGRTWSTEKLAETLGRWRDTAQTPVAWVIGGAFGLAPSVLDRATVCLSLSALTFPHRLARLVLMEQLYRASTILSGVPYHKA